MEDMILKILGDGSTEHLSVDLPQMSQAELDELKQVVNDWVGSRPTDR